MRNWYYYLHVNGQLIGKNPIVVESDPEYFNSKFVVKYWKIDMEKPEQMNDMMKEVRNLKQKILH